jgi:hypothetical protein
MGQEYIAQAGQLLVKCARISKGEAAVLGPAASPASYSRYPIVKDVRRVVVGWTRVSLAKLCQSSGRAADARAVLAPALQGFSPTPEFPEIVEAQALLAALQS